MMKCTTCKKLGKREFCSKECEKKFNKFETSIATHPQTGRYLPSKDLLYYATKVN